MQIKIQIPLPPLPNSAASPKCWAQWTAPSRKVGGAIESTERLKKGADAEAADEGIGHERFKESEVGRVPEEWG